VATDACYDQNWGGADWSQEKEDSGEILCVPMRLLGSTFLSQSANPAMDKGPGVMMAAECQRRGHRYAHEIGHAVGFDHADYAADGICGINLMGGGGQGDGLCGGPGHATEQLTFVAGTVPGNTQHGFPEIFANWRNDRDAHKTHTHAEHGAEPDEDDQPQQGEDEGSLIQRQRKAMDDVFVRCDEIEAKHGKEALQRVLKSGRVQCKMSEKSDHM